LSVPKWLYVFAFVSGFAALSYQVAWTRMLSMTFGSTTLAAGAVVAGFMGGMGLGAWLYHRVGDRDASAIRAYALLEAAIGLTAVVFTLLYLRLPEIFAASARALPAVVDSPLVRVAGVALLLVVPASCMGATYPALCRALIHSADDVDRRLGWIYGINTLGGALGSIVAGFVLIEAIGARGVVSLSVVFNLSVALASLFLWRRTRRGTLGPDPSEVDEALSSSLPTWVTGIVLFGAGLATLGYEIVWLRALHYLLGPGTYVLSGTLAIFLIGLGLGGVLYRAALRLGRPEWSLGFAQLFVAILALAAMAAENAILSSPALFDRVSAFGRGAASVHWTQGLGTGLGIAVLLLLPATLWMGLAFPLASRLFLGRVRVLTARTGLAYLLSNLGSIVGAIGAAAWVLPALGTVGGTQLFAGVNVALGLLVLLHGPARRVRVAGVALSLLIVMVGSQLPERLRFEPQVIRDNPGKSVRLFEEESELGTVQVFSWKGTPDSLAMSIDGVLIGGTKNWNERLHSKQRLLAHLPMSLDRNIRHTLNLGVASGSTLDALGRYPWVETLDGVEINPAVLRGTRSFREAAILEDPRTEVFAEDAVHYLLRTDRRYDLIINDAKESVKFSGSSRILSDELYRYARDRLTECGLFTQFIPTTHPTASLRLILRTFVGVFPETEIFLDAPNAMMLIGSRCPIGDRLRPDRADLAAAGVLPEIEGVYVQDAATLPALWVSHGRELDEVIGAGPINDWDRLPLEFWSFRIPPFTTRAMAQGMALVSEPRRFDPRGDWPDAASDEYETIRLINEAILRVNGGDRRAAQESADQAIARDPLHPLLKRLRR
jgi:spermidine synthase